MSAIPTVNIGNFASTGATTFTVGTITPPGDPDQWVLIFGLVSGGAAGDADITEVLWGGQRCINTPEVPGVVFEKLSEPSSATDMCTIALMFPIGNSNVAKTVELQCNQTYRWIGQAIIVSGADQGQVPDIQSRRGDPADFSTLSANTGAGGVIVVAAAHTREDLANTTSIALTPAVDQTIIRSNSRGSGTASEQRLHSSYKAGSGSVSGSYTADNLDQGHLWVIGFQDTSSAANLAPASSGHAHSAQPSTISVEGVISPSSSTHAHTAESVDVTSGVDAVILQPDTVDADVYDIGRTTLVNPDTLTPVLNLFGPNVPAGDGFGGWVNIKCRLTIPPGPDRVVTVNLDLNDKQTPGDPPGNGNTTGPWTGVCFRDEAVAGTIAGLDTWQTGTGYNHNPTTNVTTSQLTLQGGKTYEIAMKPRFGVRDWQAIVAWALANGASPVAADANADGTYATVTPLFRKNNVPLADQPMMAFRFGTGPFRCIRTWGAHAAEDVGDGFGWEDLQFLLTSTDPLAIQRRSSCSFLWIFENPTGRKYGTVRNETTSGAPTGDDMNRQWLDDDTSSPQVQAIRAMIDAEGWTDSFHELITFHGDQNVNVTKPFELYYNTDVPAEVELFNKLNVAFGSNNWTLVPSVSDPAGTTLGAWGNRHGAKLSITWELADARTGFPSLAAQWGSGALALETALQQIIDEGLYSSQLVPAAAVHSHAANGALVSAKAPIAPNGALHGHVADQAELGAGTSIFPQRNVHSHTASRPLISVKVSIATEDSVHGHTAGSVVITPTQQPELSPTNNVHAHQSGQAVITTKVSLRPNSAQHVHFAEQSSVGGVRVSIGPVSTHHDHAAQRSLVVLFGVNIIPVAETKVQQTVVPPKIIQNKVKHQ